MAGTEEEEHRRRHGRYFFIPAGVLIGLGVGIIVGYAAAGILIGLGLGFLASGIIRPAAAGVPEDSPAACCRHGSRWTSVLIGAFLVIVGAALVWAPVNFWNYIWPYGIGVLLILIGLSFIAKMAWRSR
ncbi:MAG TPA: hypothetical protein VLY83_04285 [Methanoregula sp.]|nr:hypothetical protein [Methanoregula sp.]